VRTARQLTESHPETKVLYVSGHADHTEQAMADSAGAIPLVEKPFGLETLMKQIRALLGGSAMSQ